MLCNTVQIACAKHTVSSHPLRYVLLKQLKKYHYEFYTVYLTMISNDSMYNYAQPPEVLALQSIWSSYFSLFVYVIIGVHTQTYSLPAITSLHCGH